MLDILVEDIRAFDPAGRGARRLALHFALFRDNYSTSFGTPTKKKVALIQRLDELILIIGGMPEVWGDDYVFVTPSTASEISELEKRKTESLNCFENATHVIKSEGSSSSQIQPKEDMVVVQAPKLNMLAFRRRDEAGALAEGAL